MCLPMKLLKAPPDILLELLPLGLARRLHKLLTSQHGALPSCVISSLVLDLCGDEIPAFWQARDWLPAEERQCT